MKVASYVGTSGLSLAFVTVVVWLSQNRFSALLIAAGIAAASALGRWWFVRRTARKGKGEGPT